MLHVADAFHHSLHRWNPQERLTGHIFSFEVCNAPVQRSSATNFHNPSYTQLPNGASRFLPRKIQILPVVSLGALFWAYPS